jgi:hypothetical protein
MRAHNKGESIVKFHSLSSLAGALSALVAALLLTSCGGGGASGDTSNTGAGLQISPVAGTIYAGVPFTFSVTGGRKPYTMTSSEPGLLSVPSQTDSNNIEVVAANPAVVDVGLQPGELPVRTVQISVRSADAQSAATSGIKVGINFLTGYGVSFTPITCPIALPAGSTGTQACAGGESAIQMDAAFNGNLFGDRQFRLSVLKGPFAFVFPQGGTGDTITVNIMQVTTGVPTQVAVLRVQDVATGVYADTAFTITGLRNNGTITPIPAKVTFTGNLTTDCGIGSSTVLVFDGTAPYSALSTSPQITVTPAQSDTNPGQFTVTIISNTPPCPSGTIVITDAQGARTTVDVTSVPGSGKPPTPPSFDVQPTTITLGCAQSGSVTAVGGSGSYSANSTNPLVTSTVSGNTVTITRAGPAGPGTGSMTTTVSVTDGSTIKTVDVTSPATCP